MSTIAYRNGTMVADAAITCNGTLIGHGRKMFRGKDGSILGVVGDASTATPLSKWIAKGFDPNRPLPTCEGDYSAFVVTTDGVIHMIEQGEVIEIAAEFYALGSGADLARGAMAVGASAEQAVVIATHLDTLTALPLTIAVVDLKNTEKPTEKLDNVVAFRRQ